jgi:hypothetical protein
LNEDDEMSQTKDSRVKPADKPLGTAAKEPPATRSESGPELTPVQLDAVVGGKGRTPRSNEG